MKKLKRLLVLMCLKFVDWILDVQRDKPVYLVFLGEGCVQIQVTGEPSQTIDL
jgi:hypothetical protein